MSSAGGPSTGQGAPVAALTVPPPPRTVQGGLVYPPPPADKALRKPALGRFGALYGAAIVASVLAAVPLSALSPALLILPVMTLLVPGLYLRRHIRAANKRLGAAGALTQERRLVDAATLLTEIAHRNRGNEQIHGLAVLQLAGVKGLRGDVEGQLELLAVASRSRSIRRFQPHLAEAIPFHIARAYAVLGETAAAEDWLALGNKKRNIVQEHTADVVTAVLRARQGRFGEAAALLDKHWERLETTASGDAMKAQRVLLAYCLDRAEGAGASARVERLLAGARPFGAEVRALVQPWPELREFLVAQVPDERVPDPI